MPKVERLHFDEANESYRISGRNKSIVLASNRPLLCNKGLKHKAPTWSLIEGTGSNMSVYDKILAALMKALE
ncbi:hypothetical protein [Foetidibacter luteolus]|uniref:hypothetical protein n=1 Tax=Foetidibacter luteolus TaxID=2608880 RepID=UPI00129BC06A|nr:hypothetical protein [Foetidibacter luteolus]